MLCVCAIVFVKYNSEMIWANTYGYCIVVGKVYILSCCIAFFTVYCTYSMWQGFAHQSQLPEWKCTIILSILSTFDGPTGQRLKPAVILLSAECVLEDFLFKLSRHNELPFGGPHPVYFPNKLSLINTPKIIFTLGQVNKINR